MFFGEFKQCVFLTPPDLTRKSRFPRPEPELPLDAPPGPDKLTLKKRSPSGKTKDIGESHGQQRPFARAWPCGATEKRDHRTPPQATIKGRTQWI
jgi:hypothetical protein